MTARSKPAPPTSAPARSGGVLAALDRLDRRLRAAIVRNERVAELQGAGAAFRGLYLDRVDVDRLLGEEPGRPRLGIDGQDPEPLVTDPLTTAWRALAETCRLSPFDLDVVLVALAPELDLRYELLYAYLQDDVTRRRPTVDLALDLLCSSWEGKLRRRARFAPDAPLVGGRVLHLGGDRDQVEPPLLARALRLDGQVVTLLLEQDTADARLTHACRMVDPPADPGLWEIRGDVMRVLLALLDAADRRHRPLRLQLCGRRGAGKRRVAGSLARRRGVRLAVVDLERLLADPDPFAQTLPLALREASWRGAVAYLAGTDALQAPERSAERRVLQEALAGPWPLVLLSGERPWTAAEGGETRIVAVPLADLDVPQATGWWHRSLAHAGAAVDGDGVDAVAARFRLGPGEIERAVAHAVQAAQWRAVEGGAGIDNGSGPTAADLLAGARAGSAPDLADLARKIESHHGWDDIVLPADARAQLREIADRLTCRHRVLDQWGFARTLPASAGTTALFTGPSGTGKTMAAEILARDVGLDLYAVDLSGVVSKYVGETEKNLARVFSAAERSGAILFFDEAEALFGRRSEVRDSHDRYANIETAYLLQRMERYDGLAVLATNLRGNLDSSFLRRLAFSVPFPFPDEEARRDIWAGIWPAETPLADDVDLDLLAREFTLSGGNIRNVAVAAAFLAAAGEEPVAMRHLLRALRREYQKLGKPFDDSGRPGAGGAGAP